MENIETFSQFNKRSKKQTYQTGKNKNTIIYTRVSTKEQAENNLSLETQLKGCMEYAKKLGYNIVEKFGGTYESAKSDERKEFQKMIDFAKKSKEGISYIFVYSLERFSRTGGNAIWLSKQLRELGISIISVTQPIDTTNPAGVLQESILFLFSQFDNDLRRQKAVAGMKEKIQKGYWIGRAPTGYDIVTKSKEQTAKINETGKLLQKAFVWKTDGLTNTEILQKLKARGLTLYNQKLNWIFTNPFYCGIIIHNLLENKPIEGKHPPLVSKELFLKVNNIQVKYKHAKHKKEFNHTPLKHFLKCDSCNTSFTGYEVKKKKLHYYKCNKKGRKCNRNAEHMHEIFINLLGKYSINSTLIEPLKDELLFRYNELNKTNMEDSKLIKGELNEIDKKISKVEERYVYGEIEKDLYDKFISKLKKEKSEIQQKFDEINFQLSNPEEYVKYSLKLASKLAEIWLSKDYSIKEELQYLLFPKGIHYNREKDDYRTNEVNTFFREIALITSERESVKKGKTDINACFSSWVGPLGIEPSTS
ncbi:MAG: recombinase family protein [Bacteroidia bacterium]